MREYRPVAPLHIGVHLRQALCQAGRQVACGHKQDAPQAAGRYDVVDGAVRGGMQPEGARQVVQLVRRQARQHDARQLQRVDPRPAHALPAHALLHEVPVESRVVRDDGGALGEVAKPRAHLQGTGGVGHHLVGDARYLHHLRGDGLLGLHEHVEGVHDLIAAKARGGNLDKLTILEIQTRGLGIEHHDVIVKQAKLRYPCTRCQCGVTCRDVVVAAWHDDGGELRQNRFVQDGPLLSNVRPHA